MTHLEDVIIICSYIVNSESEIEQWKCIMTEQTYLKMQFAVRVYAMNNDVKFNLKKTQSRFFAS